MMSNSHFNRAGLQRAAIFAGLLTLAFSVLPARAQILPPIALPSLLPDIPVIDQDGNHHSLFTDLIKGKIVVVNFGYTSCTEICPMQGERFGQLQTLLGDHLGKDVSLITISTDPANDTPEKLKAWGSRFGAKPGWTLLTGDPLTIQGLLRSLISQPRSDEKDYRHLPLIMMIDEPRGVWKQDFSLGSAFWINQTINKWLQTPGR